MNKMRKWEKIGIAAVVSAGVALGVVQSACQPSGKAGTGELVATSKPMVVDKGVAFIKVGAGEHFADLYDAQKTWLGEVAFAETRQEDLAFTLKLNDAPPTSITLDKLESNPSYTGWFNDQTFFGALLLEPALKDALLGVNVKPRRQVGSQTDLANRLKPESYTQRCDATGHDIKLNDGCNMTSCGSNQAFSNQTVKFTASLDGATQADCNTALGGLCYGGTGATWGTDSYGGYCNCTGISGYDFVMSVNCEPNGGGPCGSSFPALVDQFPQRSRHCGVDGNCSNMDLTSGAQPNCFHCAIGGSQCPPAHCPTKTHPVARGVNSTNTAQICAVNGINPGSKAACVGSDPPSTYVTTHIAANDPTHPDNITGTVVKYCRATSTINHAACNSPYNCAY